MTDLYGLLHELHELPDAVRLLKFVTDLQAQPPAETWYRHYDVNTADEAFIQRIVMGVVMDEIKPLMEELGNNRFNSALRLLQSRDLIKPKTRSTGKNSFYLFFAPTELAQDVLARIELAPLLTERLDNRTQIIPISQERHWLASSSVLGLKRFFYKASDEIAKKLSANPTRREEGLTDELVYEIFSNPQNQKFLDSLLSPSGVKIKLECEESGSAENELGCDIGMCLTVQSKGLNNRRAILLQAKRLHPNPDNFSSSSRYGDLLESHGIEQARKMLAITPCSYFLLYNPSDLHNYLKPYSDEIQIKTSLDYSTDGICILPASVMEGMNRSLWQNVVDLHPFTCSFVKFMVDDFIQGKLGDGGRRAIMASLTRNVRKNMEIDDNDEISPPRFSIIIKLDVSHMSGYSHQRNQ